MSLIFVDVEARGPCPRIGRMTEFGAVEFKSQATFHGKMFRGKAFKTILEQHKVKVGYPEGRI